MRVKLEEKVVAEKVVETVVKEALYADRCDGCGKLFDMMPFCNDSYLGQFMGTFGGVADDPETGRGMGNMFVATVCSFACAHEVFALGGWKRIPQYRPYADADIPLVRAELKITSFVRDERELRRDWEKGS
jgi:hypothetical protein